MIRGSASRHAPDVARLRQSGGVSPHTPRRPPSEGRAGSALAFVLNVPDDPCYSQRKFPACSGPGSACANYRANLFGEHHQFGTRAGLGGCLNKFPAGLEPQRPAGREGEHNR